MAKRFIPDQNKSVKVNIPPNTIAQALTDIAAGIKREQARPAVFVASVVSIAEDHSSTKVKLCTGCILDVPMSILKKVTHRGTVRSGDECLGIASGEIDVSTDVGVLIQQRAHEIDRLSHALQASKEGLRHAQGADINNISTPSDETPIAGTRTSATPFDIVMPPTAVKVTFDGIAGNPNRPAFVFYQAPPFQYIKEWEVIGIVNCFFRFPPIVGGIDAEGRTLGLQFFPDARHGTPIGTPYTGTIIVNVVLVQLTT